MGFAMSTHMVRCGLQVTGFDIYPPTLDSWIRACQAIQAAETPAAKFSSATSPAEAVAAPGVNTVVLMVATHQHVDSALFDAEVGAVRALPRNIPIIVMATVPPTYPATLRRRLVEDYDRSDVKVIDAPVSGGTVRSANGTLTIMVSSDESSTMVLPQVQLVLRSLSNQGKTLFPIPGGSGSGEAAKALNQVQCGSHIVGGAEVMVFAALAGLNTRRFLNTVEARSAKATADLPAGVDKEKYAHGWTWMICNRGPRMLNDREPLSSAIAIINKDVGIIVDEQHRLKIELPLINIAANQLKLCMDHGIASWDDAYITKFYLDPTLKDTTRMKCVIEQAAQSFRPTLNTEEAATTTSIVMQAHALINLCSAYETVKFAEALDLMGPTQRKMWFTLIAGAAGGSTIFEEVVPMAFEALDQGQRWQDGFTGYVKETVDTQWDLRAVEKLLNEVKARNSEFRPVMVEKALMFVRNLYA